MTHDKLFELLCQYEQIGFMAAVKAYEPTLDLIRETEVRAWLKMMRVDYKAFKTLVDKNLIVGKRMGKAKNSPWYYSKKEIKSAITKANVSRLMSENYMDNSNNF